MVGAEVVQQAVDVDEPEVGHGAVLVVEPSAAGERDLTEVERHRRHSDVGPDRGCLRRGGDGAEDGAASGGHGHSARRLDHGAATEGMSRHGELLGPWEKTSGTAVGGSAGGADSDAGRLRAGRVMFAASPGSHGMLKDAAVSLCVGMRHRPWVSVRHPPDYTSVNAHNLPVNTFDSERSRRWGQGGDDALGDGLRGVAVGGCRSPWWWRPRRPGGVWSSIGIVPLTLVPGQDSHRQQRVVVVSHRGAVGEEDDAQILVCGHGGDHLVSNGAGPGWIIDEVDDRFVVAVAPRPRQLNAHGLPGRLVAEVGSDDQRGELIAAGHSRQHLQAPPAVIFDARGVRACGGGRALLGRTSGASAS